MKTAICLASAFLAILLASQALAADDTVSKVLRQLKTLRPGDPIHVSIYNINGHGSSSNSIGLPSTNSQRLQFGGNGRSTSFVHNTGDLKVIGNSLTGSCSMIHQKMARRGQTAVAVESCSPFRNVRKVLLHQTQGNKEGAGRYEFANIRSCSGGTLRLQRSLRNTYSSNAVGGTSPRVSQVVPVIQARNIEVCRGGLVQAPKWNGRCGGIIAMEASGDIRVCRDSKVSASGAGFRGAPQFVSKRDWVHGYVGESEAIGYGVRRQKNGVGSAGGSSIGNSGGYGGAHASFGSAPTAGGCGKSAGKPSLTLSSNGNGRSYFGGSGGASGSHGSGRRYYPGRIGAKGGASGGMVVMIARGWIKTASASSVQANGMAGQDGYTIPGAQQAMGGGGGGAGGSVLYKEGNRKFRFQASVNGGAGGIRVKFSGGCRNSGRGGTGGSGTVAVLA